MDSRVFIIGRDPVPQIVRLAAGESIHWTFVALPPPVHVVTGDHGFPASGLLPDGTGDDKTSASLHPSQTGVWPPPVHVVTGDRGFPASGLLPDGTGDDKTSASLHPSQTGVWAPPVHVVTGDHGFPASGAVGVSEAGSGALTVNLEVDLEGPGASADLAGLYICDGDSNVSFNVLVKHSSGGCESHQLFKGLAGGRSRASFDGLIYVAEGAWKTKAYQESHNILLSRDAVVETRPQLEIYADDVECSHGATTGFLNADELFYMQSRGIPENEARRLQMISFLAPVLARLDEGLREEITASI